MALIRSNVGYIVKEKYSLDNRLRLRPKLRELLENDDYEERRKGLLVAKGLLEDNKDISEFYTLINAISLWDLSELDYYAYDNSLVARKLIEEITQIPGSSSFGGRFYDDSKARKKFENLILNSNSRNKDKDIVNLLNVNMDAINTEYGEILFESDFRVTVVNGAGRHFNPFVIRLISEKNKKSLFLALNYCSLKESYGWHPEESIMDAGLSTTVVLGLGEIRDKQAVKPLLKRFNHLSNHDENAYSGYSEAFVQHFLIARSLGKIGDFSAVETLTEALNWNWEEGYDYVIPEIERALRKIHDSID